MAEARFNRRHKLFGHLFSGRYKSLIVDGSGKGWSKRIIPAKQIASRQQQKLSLMPDNILVGLTPQELVDLVEFLSTGERAVNGQEVR